MKAFSAACKETNLSTVHFLIKANILGLNFSEIFPQVDDTYVATIKALAPDAKPKEERMGTVAQVSPGVTALLASMPPNTVRVLSKMMRRGMWGSHKAVFGMLQQVIFKRVKNLREVVDWLAKNKLLLDHAEDVYSLSVEKKSVIEQLIKHSERGVAVAQEADDEDDPALP